MSEPDQPLTTLGLLLEEARERLSLSKREAARIAGISEGRWRQVVTGIQKAGAVNVPVNPRRNTVTAMATAVRVDQAQALKAAGLEPLPSAAAADEPPTGDEAITRVMKSDLPEDKKRRLVELLNEERRHYERRTEELIHLFHVEGQ